MSKPRILLWLLTGTLLLIHAPSSEAPMTLQDTQRQQQWLTEHFLAAGAAPPFSFIFDGQASEALLPNWTRKMETGKLAAECTQYVVTWSDAKTGLEVRCVAIAYADYPALEWTVYLKNTGGQDTPIVEKIQGLDVRFTREAAAGEFVLHGIKGDWCSADSYAPYERVLAPGSVTAFAPTLGKSTGGPEGWPYYNLQFPGGGVLLALGWPGQWASSFTRDETTGLHIQAGQQLTHLRLHPGEEIRTPFVALLFWQGTDVVEAQNLWRRWYVAHVLPRIDGEAQPPIAQIQVNGGDKDVAHVQAFLDAGIHVDLCWRDAGGSRPEDIWFPAGSGPFTAPAPACSTPAPGRLIRPNIPTDLSRSPTGFTPAACSSCSGSSRNAWAIPTHGWAKITPSGCCQAPGTAQSSMKATRRPVAG